MAYLFDTDAISEVYKREPAPEYMTWLRHVPQANQFTSAVVLGELWKGAFRSPARDKWIDRIDNEIASVLTVLPYDAGVARKYGAIRADLEKSGHMPGDLDLMIAATALHHGLTVVTGNLRHFERVPGVQLVDVLAKARTGQSLRVRGKSPPRS